MENQDKTVIQEDEQQDNSNYAERTLLRIANITLVSGIAVAFIAFGYAAVIEAGFLYYLIPLPILLISTTTWALLKVLCGMSENIRGIKDARK